MSSISRRRFLEDSMFAAVAGTAACGLNDQVFAAGFVGGPLDRRLRSLTNVLYNEEIYGHGQRPLLRLYELDARSVATTPASGSPNPPPPRKTPPR